MECPQPVGLCYPYRFHSGQILQNGFNELVSAPNTNLIYAITCIDVFYNGTGDTPLIQFSVGTDQPFWASGPDAGTVHTEQYRGLVVLSYGNGLWCDAQVSQWGVNVAGFMGVWPGID